MVNAVLAVGEADRLIVVVPEVVELPPGGPTLADGEGTAQLVQRRVTGNDDDLTTREYRPGDALRRVHWRASARHGELMVRQEEHRSHPDARIVIDTRQSGYPDAVPDPGDSWSPTAHSEAFEWVVRMTASLGSHLEASGFRVLIEETAVPQVEPLGERWQGGRRSEGFLTSLAAVRLVDRRAGCRGHLGHGRPRGSGLRAAVRPGRGDRHLAAQAAPGRPGRDRVPDEPAPARARSASPRAAGSASTCTTRREPGDAWRSAGHDAGVPV